MALIKPRPRLRGGGVQTRHPHTCLGNLVGLMLGKSSEESHSERLPYSCQVCQFYQRVYQVVSTPQDSSRGENRDDACTKIPLYACIYIPGTYTGTIPDDAVRGAGQCTGGLVADLGVDERAPPRLHTRDHSK